MDSGEVFEKVFAGLNAAQKAAVEQIDGPLLVIAGPGTGKTQLLSARVAHILRATDTLAQNILCLTFTESGAANMRERLTRFIGPDAYNVNIGTYHAFGGDLIRRFPEYFAETRLQSPVDELVKRQIVAEIIEQMSYLNPLKSTQYHLGDLIATISEVKRGLLDEKSLRAIAVENALFVVSSSKATHDIFEGFAKMPTKHDKAAPYFERLLQALREFAPAEPASPTFAPLAVVAIAELEQALDQAAADNSTKPLTKWKNAWLAKDSDNHFVFAGELQNQRIEALADVFQQYQGELSKRGLYDFDDMILRSISALEQHADLRYTLQEQYLYILLDEFQDTNAAQAKLVHLLTENPVNEGRPNVMAVGDDDQAIYAFQGAEYSNMLDFYKAYRDVRVVNLTENYRSHSDILHVAEQIATQISTRLETHFEHMSKLLVAANKNLTTSHVSRQEFLSDVAQYDFIAHEIAKLIKQGTSPSEIAVLAPRHKQLEPLVPYLNELDIPVRYEKREDILDTPAVRQLITMSKLVLALHAQNESAASSLWPEVLSYDFWHIPTSEIWKLSWQVADSHGELSWSKALLAHQTFREPALLFLTLAPRADTETLENMLDYFIGTLEPETHEADTPHIRSPMREYYNGPTAQKSQPELFYETLSHLSVLRAKLRDHQATQEHALTLRDFLEFITLYEQAEMRMTNTSPYNQHAEAVQLMTVFKAKGLEFEHVFLPSCQDDVWGESSRASSNKLTLPPNLAPIRHAGASEDERLRIFFVAVTRAKIGLYFESFLQKYSGSMTKRLKYLHEEEQGDGSFKALVLPENSQPVEHTDDEVPALETLEANWQTRHWNGLAELRLRDLLSERLANYQLSPTHLGMFTDMIYGGPEVFFYQTMLRFPQAPMADGQFGNAIHETLEWTQIQVNQHETLPPIADILKYFATAMTAKKLAADQTERLIERGQHALKTYLNQRGQTFQKGNKPEYNFRNEGVLIGDVHMSGKIDRMDIDTASKTITVVDYKTGKTFDRWSSDAKLHKYKRQLYCYKLLIENSRTYRGYKVEQGVLDFIEPDENGKTYSLSLNFNDKELGETKALLAAMWVCVRDLNFPLVSDYPATLTGIKQFETDLLNNNCKFSN
jgi:DNA helicase-2/ATP-dependent DNA helicase PcrA